MKYFLILSIFSLGIAKNETNTNDTNLHNLNHSSLNELMSYETGIGEITAVINDYADLVFHNVQKYIIRTGLDPIEMPDQSIKLFPTGTINLTKGWLEDTSTLSRYNDVVITYRSFTKEISCVIPIKFHSLMFIYKYHTKVLFLNRTGDAQGKVTNVMANIHISFNFEKYEASLDKLDITDTGEISLTFSGNGLLDWITNAMTTSVNLVLHPIIIRIIQTMVKVGLDRTVALINENIKDILYNQTSEFLFSELPDYIF